MTAEQFGLSLLGAAAFAVAANAVIAPLRGGPRARMGLAAAALLLLTAGALYLVVGRPDALAPPVAAADPAERFALEIEARIAQSPEDPVAWRMLGGVRAMQGRYADAASAFSRARVLSGDTDVGALVGFAEAQVLQDPQQLAAMAPLFARALELDPDDQRALWYGGHAAADAGDRARAVALWTRLLAQDIPEPLRAAVRAQLDQGTAAAPVLLEVEVALAPRLAARIPADAPLFVFVRSPDRPQPVLAKRLSAPSLPLRIAFTAADRLGPEVALAPGFTVGARLSRSGTANRGSGDLEGSATLGAGGIVAVTLDREVP